MSDLILIYSADSQVKCSLYCTMINKTFRYIYDLNHALFYIFTTVLHYNSRWTACVSSTRCEQRRHKHHRGGTRITYDARMSNKTIIRGFAEIVLRDEILPDALN